MLSGAKVVNKNFVNEQAFPVLGEKSKNVQGPKSWAWLPEFCRTFGDPCESSSADPYDDWPYRRVQLGDTHS